MLTECACTNVHSQIFWPHSVVIFFKAHSMQPFLAAFVTGVTAYHFASDVCILWTKQEKPPSAWWKWKIIIMFAVLGVFSSGDAVVCVLLLTASCMATWMSTLSEESSVMLKTAVGCCRWWNMVQKPALAGITWCTMLAGTRGESRLVLQNQLGVAVREAYLVEDKGFQALLIWSTQM